MDHKVKYDQLINFIGIGDISEEYPEASYFEKIILALRKHGWNYGDIQKSLGMPPKKEIRNVLLKWAPELIDNSKTKTVKCSTPYAEIYNILVHTDKKIWTIFDEPVECFIKDNVIYYDGDPLNWYTEADQNQILNELKNNG